jgi:parallel beta-helix repeat protein
MTMKKCCGVHALRIAVGITMLALLLAGNANAANLTVCPSGCAYSSIQKAIMASSNGDSILVQSGTYFENVKVNKKLILRGIDNPVVYARGNGSAITLSANGITLEGFSVGGGGSYYLEAGIKVNSNNNTLSDNNASNNGYGISLVNSSNNTLSGNNASNNGYGISLFNPATTRLAATMHRTTITAYIYYLSATTTRLPAIMPVRTIIGASLYNIPATTRLAATMFPTKMAFICGSTVTTTR